MTSPYGNMSAASVRSRPGACSWYHGAVFVDTRVAHANARIVPAATALRKVLSSRMWALVTPWRETISRAWAGVYAFEGVWGSVRGG